MNQVAVARAGWGNRAEQFIAQHPWRSALLLAPLLFAVFAAIFRPAYETNDDAAMSMIAAGKLIATAPDEHLVFTHPVIGLALKNLYTLAPNVSWYGLYLLATQIAAHTVIAGLLFLYCPPHRALAWFLFWMTSIGIYFITHLQFTTTSFLAGMAGVLLLWEAARRVANRASATREPAAAARSVLGLLIAGGALVLWCEMIRWYMFYLIAMLPLPALGIWWLWRRPGWRITAQAAGVAALVILSGYGLKEMHLAYYHADPEWRDFYEYNELRAQFNDTVKVVYNDQTRPSFEQVGWTAIDMQMMASWCYEDTTVFSHAKLQQIWDSRVWKAAERKNLDAVLLEMEPLLLEPQLQLCLFLLAILMFLMPLDRRHLSFNAVVLGTTLGALLLLSMLQKIPPPRVYMPIMVWTVTAIAWTTLNRSLVRPGTKPALSILQVFQKIVALPFHNTSNRGLVYLLARGVPVCAVLVALGVTIKEQRLFHEERKAAQRQFRDDLRAFQPEASKLYVLWGATLPMEDLTPLKSFKELGDLHLLWFGWPQQMPAHRAMKARYGITNLMQEWPDHPEVQLICPPICTEFYANYTKEHYDLEVRAVQTGSFKGNPVFQFQKVGGDAVAEQPRHSQTE